MFNSPAVIGIMSSVGAGSRMDIQQQFHKMPESDIDVLVESGVLTETDKQFWSVITALALNDMFHEEEIQDCVFDEDALTITITSLVIDEVVVIKLGKGGVHVTVVVDEETYVDDTYADISQYIMFIKSVCVEFDDESYDHMRSHWGENV